MSETIWISHRGIREAAPENTRGAFDAALAAGYRHLETDLRASADGHVVLSHDASLARLAGVPLVVEASSRAALAQVALPGGERLMFLDELLTEYREQRWILDIKPESARATLAQLQRLSAAPATRRWLVEQVRYLFWSRALQRQWEAAQPGVICMARESECRRAGWTLLAGVAGLAGLVAGKTYALPPCLRGRPILHRELVEAAQRRGARVLAFLPQNPAEVRLALAAGVDEILYDDVLQPQWLSR